jgi:DNA-binding IclR family transcriptional regulator
MPCRAKSLNLQQNPTVPNIDPIVEKGVMDRLQEQKGGQTIEELQAHLRVPPSKIYSVLRQYQSEGYVDRSSAGVWTLVRDVF